MAFSSSHENGNNLLEPSFRIFGGGNQTSVPQAPCGKVVGEVHVKDKKIVYDIRVWDADDCPTSIDLHGPLDAGATDADLIGTLDLTNYNDFTGIEHESGDVCTGACNRRYHGHLDVDVCTADAFKAFQSLFYFQSYSDAAPSGQHRIFNGNYYRS